MLKPVAVLILLLFVNGCGLFVTRPVQEMAFAEAALRAAKDVRADTLAPEYYRRAYESFLRAKKFYKGKYFDAAKKYSLKTKSLAEKAEFIAYKKGGAIPQGGAEE